MTSGRCPRCLFSVGVCLCAAIPALVTTTRVVILRHQTERFRASNSGRLAHQALQGSVLHDLFGIDRREGELPIGPGAWLVYPEGVPALVAPVPPPQELVFLDATWRQARRMRQRVTALRGMPVLALAAVAGPARMRRAPRSEHVSTIEAIAHALRLVEGGDAPDALERLFARAVENMRRMGRGIVDPEG